MFSVKVRQIFSKNTHPSHLYWSGSGKQTGHAFPWDTKKRSVDFLDFTKLARIWRFRMGGPQGTAMQTAQVLLSLDPSRQHELRKSKCLLDTQTGVSHATYNLEYLLEGLI